MSEIIVRVAHLASDLGRDVTDDDSRHVAFAAGEVVAVEVQVVEDLLTWDHLDVLTSASRFRGELRGLVHVAMMIIFMSPFLMILSTGMTWSWELFFFLTSRRIVVGVVQLNRHFFNVHWFMMMVRWVRSFLCLLMVVIVVLLVRHRGFFMILFMMVILLFRLEVGDVLLHVIEPVSHGFFDMFLLWNLFLTVIMLRRSLLR